MTQRKFGNDRISGSGHRDMPGVSMAQALVTLPQIEQWWRGARGENQRDLPNGARQLDFYPMGASRITGLKNLTKINLTLDPPAFYRRPNGELEAIVHATFGAGGDFTGKGRFRVTSLPGGQGVRITSEWPPEDGGVLTHGLKAFLFMEQIVGRFHFALEERNGLPGLEETARDTFIQE